MKNLLPFLKLHHFYRESQKNVLCQLEGAVDRTARVASSCGANFRIEVESKTKPIICIRCSSWILIPEGIKRVKYDKILTSLWSDRSSSKEKRSCINFVTFLFWLKSTVLFFLVLSRCKWGWILKIIIIMMIITTTTMIMEIQRLPRKLCDFEVVSRHWSALNAHDHSVNC